MVLLDKLLTRSVGIYVHGVLCFWLIVVCVIAKRLREQGSRVLIFSQMTRLLDILEVLTVFQCKRIVLSVSVL